MNTIKKRKITRITIYKKRKLHELHTIAEAKIAGIAVYKKAGNIFILDCMSKQAFLFPELEAEETGEADKKADTASAKTLLRELYKIRASNPDNIFMPTINALIEKCRNFSLAAPSQVEEKIFYAIEKQMCWTLSEIVEETKISREVVSEILEELKKQNLVRFVPKNSDRKHFLIKSNRS